MEKFEVKGGKIVESRLKTEKKVLKFPPRPIEKAKTTTPRFETLVVMGHLIPALREAWVDFENMNSNEIADIALEKLIEFGHLIDSLRDEAEIRKEMIQNYRKIEANFIKAVAGLQEHVESLEKSLRKCSGQRETLKLAVEDAMRKAKLARDI